jgi:hypothetical protein
MHFVPVRCKTMAALALAIWAGLGWTAPGRAAEGDALKGEARKVEDATVTPLELDAKSLLPCLLWLDDKGSAFLALDGATGVLRRIAVPDFTVAKQKDLGRKATWLSPSAEGPIVSVADTGEVWVLDKDTYDVKKKIAVPNLKRAVSAEGLSVAFAASITGNELYTVDLKAGRTAKFMPPPKYDRGGFIDPVLSPDGRYLFLGTPFGNCGRFRNEEGRLAFVDKIRLHGGSGLGICVSPDSKFVCQPAAGGNVDAGGSYCTIVFIIDTFAKKECILEIGAHPKQVGWDPAGNAIYTGNSGTTLLVFTLAGVKQKEYTIDKAATQRQYLAHPQGKKLLLLTTEKLYFVELPG